LYIVDTWSSVALRLPKALPLRTIPLPIAEHEFANLDPEDIPVAPRCDTMFVPQDSMMAHSVIINMKFTRIYDINVKTVSGELQDCDLLEAVQQIWLELESWESGLSNRLRNTPENLKYWAGCGLASSFVTLHLEFSYLCLLLFYQFLYSQQRHQHRLAADFARMCVDHATAICRLIHLADEISGARLLSSILAHVLTVASTVHLFTLLFSEDPGEISRARDLLGRNFSILTSLRVYWSTVDISFARFETFHRACIQLQDDDQFRLDQWMLTFMLGFATPISDQERETAEEGATAFKAFSLECSTDDDNLSWTAAAP
jgi:hypothetical protein